jgi:hypothetical protein
MSDLPVMRLGSDGVMRLGDTGSSARPQVREVLEKAHADAGIETNPADAEDFYDAFARMVRTFKEAEGREPNENDDNFLTAAIALYERFFGEGREDAADRKPVKKASGAARQALGSGGRVVLGAVEMFKASHQPVNNPPPSGNGRRVVLTGRGE